MAAPELVAISCAVTIVVLLVGLRTLRSRRRRAAADPVPEVEDQLRVDGPADSEPPALEATEPEVRPEASGPAEAAPNSRDDRVLRLCLLTLEELVEEQAAQIAELRSRVPHTDLEPAQTPAQAQARAAVVRDALADLRGPDAEARIAATLSRLDAPRVFARPEVALASPQADRDPGDIPPAPPVATTSPVVQSAPIESEPEVNPPVDTVDPLPPPLPVPEVVLPVPAPPAPAAPPRRRFFRSRAA